MGKSEKTFSIRVPEDVQVAMKYNAEACDVTVSKYLQRLHREYGSELVQRCKIIAGDEVKR